MKKILLQNSKFFTSKFYAIGLVSIGFFANSCYHELQNSFMKNTEEPTELGSRASIIPKEETESNNITAKSEENLIAPKLEQGEVSEVKQEKIDETEVLQIEIQNEEFEKVLNKENFLKNAYARIETIDSEMERLRLEKSDLRDSIDVYMKNLRGEIKILTADLKKAEPGDKRDEINKKLTQLKIELEEDKIFIDKEKLAKKTAKLEGLKAI